MIQFSFQSREDRCMPQGHTGQDFEAELPDRVRENKILFYFVGFFLFEETTQEN